MIDRILDVMQSRGLMADETDARAVIEAMREPTEAVYLARPCDIPERPVWRKLWDGIIDALLEQPSASPEKGQPH